MADPNQDLDALRAHLADHDAPCPNCAYSLRGLASDRCPECNQEIRLTVGLAEPRIGLYLLALLPVLSGAGLCAVMLVCVAVMTLLKGSPGSRAHFLIYYLPSIALLVLGTAAALLLTRAGRRWFRSLDPSPRTQAIVASWGLLAAFMGWFLYLFSKI